MPLEYVRLDFAVVRYLSVFMANQAWLAYSFKQALHYRCFAAFRMSDKYLIKLSLSQKIYLTIWKLEEIIGKCDHGNALSGTCCNRR